MGRFRDKMDADLRLAGHAESTRPHYIGCARAFVKHHRRPPDEMGEPEVRSFLLFLREERKLSTGRYRQYVAALRFLYAVTLGRPEVTAGIPWPRATPRKLQVMTRLDVASVIDHAPSPFWRVFFATAYATGLRRMEVAALAVTDIDAGAGLIHVRRGKGGAPRSVMLDPGRLVILREHWRVHRSPRWIFPAPDHSGWSEHPVSPEAASDAFRKASTAARPSFRATLHDLRRAFATHLLEDGVDLATIQALLGHADIASTTVYTHVRTDRVRATPSPLAKLRT